MSLKIEKQSEGTKDTVLLSGRYNDGAGTGSFYGKGTERYTGACIWSDGSGVYFISRLACTPESTEIYE